MYDFFLLLAAMNMLKKNKERWAVQVKLIRGRLQARYQPRHFFAVKWTVYSYINGKSSSALSTWVLTHHCSSVLDLRVLLDYPPGYLRGIFFTSSGVRDGEWHEAQSRADPKVESQGQTRK